MSLLKLFKVATSIYLGCFTVGEVAAGTEVVGSITSVGQSVGFAGAGYATRLVSAGAEEGTSGEEGEHEVEMYGKGQKRKTDKACLGTI